MPAGDIGAVPVRHRCFEDYAPGASGTFGPIAITEADIVEFARRYDPQPIHTDPAAAAAGPFAGLIASGWQTVGLVMRTLVEHYLSPSAAIVSPGVDELRWTRPVRPGEELRAEIEVLEARPSESRPEQGWVKIRTTTRNQKLIRVDAENNLLLICGSVPGPNGGFVVIKPTNKL